MDVTLLTIAFLTGWMMDSWRKAPGLALPLAGALAAWNLLHSTVPTISGMKQLFGFTFTGIMLGLMVTAAVLLLGCWSGLASRLACDWLGRTLKTAA